MPDAPEVRADPSPMRGAPTDPIAAVTHPDPYAHYAALRAEAALHWFPDRKLWALVSAPGVTTALHMPAAKVRQPSEPIPHFLQGSPAGEPFGRLARMSDGTAHAAQRGRTMLLVRKLGCTNSSVAAGPQASRRRATLAVCPFVVRFIMN